MAQDFKTSFIPKKTIQQEQSSGGSSGGSAGLLLIIALIIFLLTFAAGVGAFLYKTYLERSLTQKESTLNEAQSAFDPELIRELTRLDDRLSIAQDLLDTHVAPSLFFTELEQITLANVSFTSFDVVARDAETYVLELSGEARDFAAVAQQSRLFGESPFIVDPVFSNLDVNDAGDVTFDVAAQINATELLYTDNLDAFRSLGTTTSTTTNTNSQ